MWKCFEKAIQGEYMTHKEAGFDCLKALSEQFKGTNQGEIREKLNGLVKQFLDAENRKQQPHLLIHLDEHRKLLCLDSATENSWREQCGQKFVTAVNEKCANFRRGAWQALTELANTRIIATYVDFPYELPGGTGESSAGCRTAVAKPVLDVAKLMEYLYQLRLPKLLEDICIHAHNKRRLATLQICLGLVLDGENTIQATSQRQSISLAGIWCEDTPSTNFLNEFADLSQKAQSAYEEYGDGNKCLKEMLTSCQKLCKETFQAHCSQLWQANVQDLLDLLLGMPETKVAGRIRAVDSGLISLWGGESLTVSLKVLLNALPFDTDCTKPYRTLFKQCQPCLRDAIFESSDDASTDVCANRILEASYMWTIAMQQYRKHEPNVRVPISGQKFTDVKLDGRIFAVERDQQGLFISVDLQGIRNLRPGVLYRAQDKHQNGTHPWADMWYATLCPCVIFFGIEADIFVLAPNLADGSLSESDKNWQIVQAASPARRQLGGWQIVQAASPARRQLGGLSQLLVWLGSDEIDKESSPQKPTQGARLNFLPFVAARKKKNSSKNKRRAEIRKC
ncbi:unnamed protein product [Cladocopium goreaui]|uniref:EamA domain-containing protein n=1 Tax=Cladocopium goreaui TaxID=2562237 RepID=A0A9P1C9I6_9DINO|nr:unnamed protein product [Cladocopium goreaui]